MEAARNLEQKIEGNSNVAKLFKIENCKKTFSYCDKMTSLGSLSHLML
jgi:hypothetical protein